VAVTLLPLMEMDCSMGDESKAGPAQRRAWCREALANGVWVSELLDAFLGRFPDVSVAVAEAEIDAVRNGMLEAGKVAEDEARAGALAFYQLVKQDSGAAVMARLKAQERIDKLFNLVKPLKVVRTDREVRDMDLRPGPAEMRAKMMAELERTDAVDDEAFASGSSASVSAVQESKTEVAPASD
jgi:hypothetical protein